MIIGKVVGSVVSTRKSEKLIGNKFMIIEPLLQMRGGSSEVSHQNSQNNSQSNSQNNSQNNSQIVAIDIIGAGIGEYVLVAQGSAARIGCGMENAPVDAAIVGIIDDGAGLEAGYGN